MSPSCEGLLSVLKAFELESLGSREPLKIFKQESDRTTCMSLSPFLGCFYDSLILWRLILASVSGMDWRSKNYRISKAYKEAVGVVQRSANEGNEDGAREEGTELVQK